MVTSSFGIHFKIRAMNQQRDNSEDMALTVSRWLLEHYPDQLTEDKILGLTQVISIYVRRSKLPLDASVPKICTHFMQDGPFVHQLLADPDGQGWQVVLEQIISFATAHPYYPTAEQANSWPDLDAYEDIRRKLPSYNFEGPLDHWINATVVRRLTRFWRDQQALKAGGGGFRSAAERSNTSQPAPSRVQHVSLHPDTDDDVPLAERMVAEQPAVDNQVEMAELERLVTRAVDLYATNKFDPQLRELWHALADQEYKLREVAEQLGLTVGQVYHRYLQLRAHLRADPEISNWFDPQG